MQNRIIALLVGMILMLSSYLSSHGPDTLWTKTYGGADDDCGYSIQITPDNGYVIAGKVSADVALLRTDTLGNTIWTKYYGGMGSIGACVQVTADSGFIVAGIAEFVQQNPDVYLIRTDSDGDTLWTRTFDNGYEDVARSVKQTSDAGFVVVGWTWISGNGLEVYLVKTDSLGNVVWSKTYGGPNDQIGTCVQPTIDGGYIISATKALPTVDIWLIKTDSTGDTLWTKTFADTGNDQARSVLQTADRGFVLAGSTNSWGAGSCDVLLIKTDSLGNELWKKTYGGSDVDEGSTVRVTSDGNLIITGCSASFGGSYCSFYLVKADPSGNIVWETSLKSASSDAAWDIQETDDHGFIMVGYRCLGLNDIYLVKTNPFSLISPNGGEILLWDETHNILWFCEKYPGVSHTYRLLLSTDGGNSYGDTIAENISPDSSLWLWTIPHVYSTTCRMKVEILDSLNNPIDEDQSDADFSIAQTGVEEQKKNRERDFRIGFSPNPFTTVTRFEVLGTGKNQKSNIAIYDAAGRLAKSVKLETNTYQLGADLVPGVYFLKLNGKSAGKVVKLR